jgi:hypothetical protein
MLPNLKSKPTQQQKCHKSQATNHYQNWSLASRIPLKSITGFKPTPSIRSVLTIGKTNCLLNHFEIWRFASFACVVCVINDDPSSKSYHIK